MANVKKSCNCNTGAGAYAIFKIRADGAAWGSIVGNIELQQDLIAWFDKCFRIDNVTTSGNIKITENEEDSTYNIGTESFVFVQEEATDTWIIEHNLNKYPQVICVDTIGKQFFGEVVYDSPNQVTIFFNGAIGGMAFLN